jgi:hypothetical protein
MVFTKLCWIVTFFAACAAALIVFDTLVKAQSAPQQAAGAALALAVAVIPYVFTRAVAGISAAAITKVELVGVADALRQRREPPAPPFPNVG